MDAVKTQIVKQYLEEIKKIDVVQDLHKMIWPFCLSTELWENYFERTPVVDLNLLERAKFFSDDGKTISDEVKNIPTSKGGIYIYFVENPIIPSVGRYIFYVGRARKTASENLRSRIRSHYNKYIRFEESDRLTRLFDDWKKYTYVMYLPIDDNDTIDLVEDELIVALTPPCNKEYAATAVREKLSASFYV